MSEAIVSEGRRLWDRCAELGRWSAAAHRPPEAAWRPLFDEGAARYRERHRRYHTSSHLHAMYDVLDAWRPRLSPELSMALEVSVLGHDWVYVPGSKTNELDSAVLFTRSLTRLGFAGRRLRPIARAILATRRHECGGAFELGRHLIDLDLWAIADADEYRRNGRLIREEFAVFGDDEFTEGRKAFLRDYGTRPRIFRTAMGAEREHEARRNMLDELAVLDSGVRTW